MDTSQVFARSLNEFSFFFQKFRSLFWWRSNISLLCPPPPLPLHPCLPCQRQPGPPCIKKFTHRKRGNASKFTHNLVLNSGRYPKAWINSFVIGADVSIVFNFGRAAVVTRLDPALNDSVRSYSSSRALPLFSWSAFIKEFTLAKLVTSQKNTRFLVDSRGSPLTMGKPSGARRLLS